LEFDDQARLVSELNAVPRDWPDSLPIRSVI